jgi:uncharacterized protein YcfJ
MKNLKTIIAVTLAIPLFTASSASFAGNKNKNNTNNRIGQHYDYAKVINVRPIYREVRVSTPIRECWDEPVIHSTGRYSHPKSASGMAVGGILGGVIGHQVGNGSGRKLATALGVIIGAGIGHDRVNDHVQSSQRHRYTSRYTEYEEQCEVQHQVSYDEVVDRYDVTYRYQGERYNVEMPYHPGKRIKLGINVIY